VEPSQQEKEASVHPEPAPRGNKAASVHECVVDNHEPRDARNDINERRRRKSGDGAIEATTSTKAGVTTARKIVARHLSHWALRFSARPFTKHYFRFGFTPQ
jgi:hypothetical protein